MRLIENKVDVLISIDTEAERNFLKNILQAAQMTFSIYEIEAGDVLEIPFGAYLLKEKVTRGKK